MRIGGRDEPKSRDHDEVHVQSGRVRPGDGQRRRVIKDWRRPEDERHEAGRRAGFPPCLTEHAEK